MGADQGKVCVVDLDLLRRRKDELGRFISVYGGSEQDHRDHMAMKVALSRAAVPEDKSERDRLWEVAERMRSHYPNPMWLDDLDDDDKTGVRRHPGTTISLADLREIDTVLRGVCCKKQEDDQRVIQSARMEAARLVRDHIADWLWGQSVHRPDDQTKMHKHASDVARRGGSHPGTIRSLLEKCGEEIEALDLEQILAEGGRDG